jgi:hypothetical protein
MSSGGTSDITGGAENVVPEEDVRRPGPPAQRAALTRYSDR